MFGYGSLAAGWTGGRIVEVAGWQRAWGVAMDNRRDLPGYKYYTDPEGNRPPVLVAFPDIRLVATASVTGVLRPVDPEQLAVFDRRERNYRRVDITEWIDADPGDRVWAYVGSEPARRRFDAGLRTRRAGREDGAAVIHGEYLRLVLAGFAALGETAAARCRRSLAPGELPVRELVRHELPG